MDEGVKTLLTSRTFYGVVVSVISKILTMWFGLEIDDEMQQQLLVLITTVIGLFGDAVALWGRINAKKTIVMKKS